jgi:hypothetical protein
VSPSSEWGAVAGLGAFERPGVTGRVGQRRCEVCLGVGRLGEEPASASHELTQPRPGSGIQAGQRALQLRPGFEAPIGAYRGSGEVGDG